MRRILPRRSLVFAAGHPWPLSPVVIQRSPLPGLRDGEQYAGGGHVQGFAVDGVADHAPIRLGANVKVNAMVGLEGRIQGYAQQPVAAGLELGGEARISGQIPYLDHGLPDGIVFAQQSLALGEINAHLAGGIHVEGHLHGLFRVLVGGVGHQGLQGEIRRQQGAAIGIGERREGVRERA
jgi:hypothetical protein